MFTQKYPNLVTQYGMSGKEVTSMTHAEIKELFIVPLMAVDVATASDLETVLDNQVCAEKDRLHIRATYTCHSHAVAAARLNRLVPRRPCFRWL